METSDSEYFESADEDLSSSENEEKSENSKRSVEQNLSYKSFEPKVCKLQSDPRGKNLKVEAKEEVSNIRKVTQSEKSQISNEDSNITLNLVSEKWDNKNLIETSKNVINQEKIESTADKSREALRGKNENTLITATEVVNANLPVSESKQNITRNQLQNDAVKTSKPQQEMIFEINLPISESKQNITSNQLQIDSVKTTEPKQEMIFEREDILWDDNDEINWESEAAKEESEKTDEQSPNSRNEDSGWYEFVLEWKSENQTEKVVPKSNTAQGKDTNKSDTNVSPTKENLWEDDDDWEPLEKPEDKPKPTEEQSGWGGWGNWGVSSILNSATQGVSTLTSHVSQGLSTVLEGGIGIPDPEELAKINVLGQEGNGPNEQKREETKHASDDSPVFGLDNLVSGMSQLTKFVESTGTKVITGGLDTLEAIGKKTVEVLQEGDPGLKKKRAFLKLDTGKPNLSQILREAKEKAESENQAFQQKYTEVKRTKNYEALFDDHQGLVHLEALEMLSRLCSIKLSNLNNSLTGDALKDMQETVEQVKELCELPEDEEEEKISLEESRETITDAVKEINIPISYDKLFLTCEESDTWLKNINLDFIDDQELHQQAIETLAQLTAFAVEQFHKTGELLLVKDHRSTADEADSLVQITTTLKSLILCQAGKFTDKLSSVEKANKDNISEHITNIFYEAANSGTYIQNAFQLLIPVLQVGAV